MRLDAQAIANALESGRTDALCAELSRHGLSDAEGALLRSERIDSRLLAVAGFVTTLLRKTESRVALAIAEAVRTTSERALEAGGGAKIRILAEMRAAGIDLTSSACEVLGDLERVVQLGRLAQTLVENTDATRATTVALRAVGPLIEFGRLEEAKKVFAEAEQYAALCATRGGLVPPYLNMVQGRLARALRSSTEVVRAVTSDEAAASDYHRQHTEIINTLSKFAESSQPGLGAMVAQLHQQISAPNGVREVLSRSAAAAMGMASLLGQSGSDLRRHQSAFYAVGDLLTDPKRGRDPDSLREAIDPLCAARAWFEANGYPSEALDTLWTEAVVHRRLGNHAKALKRLTALRHGVAEQRANVADPLERAGLHAKFPYLYEASIDSAIHVGDIEVAFSVAELSKGRAIADLRAIRDGQAVADIEGASDDVDELVAELGVDYLSYFVGADATTGFLITASGALHHHRLQIDKRRLEHLMQRVDPRSWRVGAFATTPVSQELAKLVDWALLKLKSPILVIAPDDPLHNLPFHYLQVSGQPLIDRVTTMRVHGVDDLRRIARTAPVRPSRGLAVYVPASDEQGVSDRQKHFETFAASIPVPLDPSEPEHFDRAQAAALQLPGALVHLAAHGFYPKATSSRATPERSLAEPFSGSGLLLARDGSFQPRGAAPLSEHLLSPKIVLESAELDVTDATIGIQACVSGLSREGRGGDALGLEWALLARGAATVVASHWNVDFTPALGFFHAFYRGWLGEGLSRAAAFAGAIHELRSDPAYASDEHAWAAFTLTGDWR